MATPSQGPRRIDPRRGGVLVPQITVVSPLDGGLAQLTPPRYLSNDWGPPKFSRILSRRDGLKIVQHFSAGLAVTYRSTSPGGTTETLRLARSSHTFCRPSGTLLRSIHEISAPKCWARVECRSGAKISDLSEVSRLSSAVQRPSRGRLLRRGRLAIAKPLGNRSGLRAGAGSWPLLRSPVRARITLATEREFVWNV